MYTQIFDFLVPQGLKPTYPKRFMYGLKPVPFTKIEYFGSL